MKLSELLIEARRKDKTYTEKRTKGVLQKVTMELEGSESAVMSRLAKRYMRLDDTMKKAKEMRDQLNAKVKMLGDELFDADDTLATRIMETASYTLLLTAAEKAEHKTAKQNVNYEKAFTELIKLVPELEEQAKKLLEAYTELVPPKDTPTQLKVTMHEGVWHDILGVLRKFKKQLTSWAAGYDKKLDTIKQAYPV